jgi:hypothetical protein
MMGAEGLAVLTGFYTVGYEGYRTASLEQLVDRVGRDLLRSFPPRDPAHPWLAGFREAALPIVLVVRRYGKRSRYRPYRTELIAAAAPLEALVTRVTDAAIVLH